MNKAELMKSRTVETHSCLSVVFQYTKPPLYYNILAKTLLLTCCLCFYFLTTQLGLGSMISWVRDVDVLPALPVRKYCI